MSRRPHVVPAGYQRNFTDGGPRIQVVVKSTRRAQMQGIRDTFTSSNFLRTIVNGVASDEAEDHFGAVEDVVLPAVRELRAGHARDARHVAAVKGLAAMLWSRSFSLELVRQRVMEEVVAAHADAFEADEDMHIRFRSDYGRSPMPGELASAVREAAAEMHRRRVETVRTMLVYHNRAVVKFRPMHVSVCEAGPSAEFVTSDNPVILARDHELIWVGAHNQIALGDAHMLVLPISRRVAVALTTEPEGDAELRAKDVLMVNNATWRNSLERVAGHPGADIEYLCGVGPRRTARAPGGHGLVTDS